jgi:hypothetical protein
LTFAPLAWLKLQWFCHAGPTEIGGFGISSRDDLLYVEEFVTVRQRVSSVSVHFLDEAVADFFDQKVDAGVPVQNFSRLWCHTNPCASVEPSSVDESTFERCFGRCDWAVMFILGRTGRTYARLAFGAGPGGQLLMPLTVDWAAWPQALAGRQNTLSELESHWQTEYAAHIEVLPHLARAPAQRLPGESSDWPAWDPAFDETFYEPILELSHDLNSSAG